MNPSELFPGAVVIFDGHVDTICSIFEHVLFSYEPLFVETRREYRIDELQPLPISPAVLRGLGFKDEEGEWLDGQRTFRVTTYRKDWFLCMGRISSEITSAHQLQALALHLYGVELTWNPEAYEEAMKEGGEK